MQVNRFSHKFLLNSLPKLHKTRCEALISTVDSLLDQGQLYLTALGRNMSGDSLVKHKIKKVDRILGNKNLHSEIPYIYKSLSMIMLKRLKELVVIVDWSGCCSQQRWILQASVAMSGRSIPIYSEIHSLKYVSNPNIQRTFLQKLYDIIPSEVNVTVVTDAGFKTPWFKEVQALGWDYVGRLRGKINLDFGAGEYIRPTEFTGNIAKNKPIYSGKATLGTSVKLITTNIYTYFKGIQGRKRIKRKYYNEGHPDKDEKYGRANREPWVLATSLEGGKSISRKVINIYKSRMQIEQNFRDMKNQRLGFGLRYSKTKRIERLEILLLIGFLATLVLLLSGIAAENKKLHYGFQANTKRDGRAISLFYLGWQVMKHGFKGGGKIKINQIHQFLDALWEAR